MYIPPADPAPPAKTDGAPTTAVPPPLERAIASPNCGVPLLVSLVREINFFCSVDELQEVPVRL
jgi:hypothetical protein